MHRNAILSSLAIGAAAIAASQGAMALNQAAVDPIVGTVNEFFFSGSSALDNDISNIMTTYCNAGTLNVWQDIDAKGVKGANWKAYTCTFSGNAALPASLQNQSVIIHKREKEGSVYGSLPLPSNSYVEFMNLKSTRASGACVVDGSAFDCTIGAFPVAPAVNTTRGNPRHDAFYGGLATEVTPGVGGNLNDDECDYQQAAPVNPVATDLDKDTICRRTTLGFSDTEAEMFRLSNINARPNASDPVNADDWAQLTSAQISGLTRKRTAGQVFGVIVSKSVFSALQLAQGIPVADPVTDGSASNWPTLSKDQIRQLLAGAAHWSDVVHGVTLAGTLNNVAICRRDQGSGTQAASNQFFFNYPCDTTNQAPARDTGGLALASGLYVAENFSGPYVKYCMNQAEAGQLLDSTSTPSTFGAIGILNANGDPSGSNTPLPDTWRWVKIDGSAPTLKNAILGIYDDWYEFQVAYKTSGGVNATEKALNDFVIAQLGTPSLISNASDKGIAALSVNGYVWDDGVNNAAGVFPANDFGPFASPVMGGKHGGTNTFNTSGPPTSCRLIQNAVDQAANLPDRKQ
ncbi:MAG TPA: hypothetical protein VLX90_19480 [Steroidobacteraceae bacterium]|nr:hypothetical protein [Steroidobacteraceae bacterium]